MFVTPAALVCYHGTPRLLALSCAVRRFFCCKAEDARRAEQWLRIRRKMLGQIGSAAVFWSEVSTAVAADSTHWGKEVRRPAMTYLSRGKKGGEQTTAYREDFTGVAA